jgi:hypothetical protein
MFCERCGRFCLFKSICSDCALETSVQRPELPVPAGTPEPSRHRFIQSLASTLGAHVKTSCRVSINVNGKTATFDLGGGVTDGLVRQVADQANLSLEEARSLKGLRSASSRWGGESPSRIISVR